MAASILLGLNSPTVTTLGLPVNSSVSAPPPATAISISGTGTTVLMKVAIPTVATLGLPVNSNILSSGAGSAPTQSWYFA